METYCGFSALFWFIIQFGYSHSTEPLSWKALERDEITGVYAYYEKHEKHTLLLPSMKNVTTMKATSLDCGFTCTALTWCVSYNFQRSSNQDGQHRCEILSGDKYNNSDDFGPNEEFDHFSIMSPCSQSPCRNGGTCVALYETNSFTCSCTSDYIGELCEVEYPTSCNQIYMHTGTSNDQAYPLKMGGGQTSTFCHMTNIPGCGDGGWTLVMKIDGSKSTFSYHAAYWTNKETYNLAGGATGLDNQETKLPSYWNTPFTKLCLGMKVGADTKFIVLHQQATSLYSLIADGQYRATSLGRDKWKSLIAGSSLQRNCNKEGFNSQPPVNTHQRVRIGIIGNEQNHCSSPDSFFGCGSVKPSHVCGNFATCHPDNGYKAISAFGYILIQ